MPGPGPRTEINQKYQSNTDPEATLVRQHGFKTRPRYKNHRLVDDAHGVITAVHTTTGRINESHELMELVDQHQANTAIAAQTIVADCKYGTIENYIARQKRKLRTHMADLLGSSPGSGRRDGIYPESMFRYQPESDTFLCPAGQLMKPRRLHSVRLTWEYVTKRGACLKCHLRKFCTRSRTGRTMRRHRDQKLLDRARRQANTRRAKLDRKRRQHLMERSFADASNLHGFKRARWRGLIKQFDPRSTHRGGPKLEKTDRGDTQSIGKYLPRFNRCTYFLPAGFHHSFNHQFALSHSIYLQSCCRRFLPAPIKSRRSGNRPSCADPY